MYSLLMEQQANPLGTAFPFARSGPATLVDSAIARRLDPDPREPGTARVGGTVRRAYSAPPPLPARRIARMGRLKA
jgi:hypothetical protein